MVIVNVFGAPTQPLFSGVMVIVATCVLLTLALTKLISPTPAAAKPILGLSFVQGRLVPAG